MKYEDILEIINPEIKELFEFLAGFGLTFYYENEESCKWFEPNEYYLEGKSKDVDIKVMNNYDNRYQIYIDPKGWFNKASQCYFKLSLPKNKKEYNSLRSYLLTVIDMRRKNISFDYHITEYGMTFNDYQKKLYKKKPKLYKYEI